MESLLWSTLLQTQSCNTRFDIKIYTQLYNIEVNDVSIIEYDRGSYNIYSNSPFVFVLDDFMLFSFDMNNLAAVLTPATKRCSFFTFDSERISKINFEMRFLAVNEC